MSSSSSGISRSCCRRHCPCCGAVVAFIVAALGEVAVAMWSCGVSAISCCRYLVVAPAILYCMNAGATIVAQSCCD